MNGLGGPDEAQHLKAELRKRFHGKPISHAGAVVGIARTLLVAEAEAEGDASFDEATNKIAEKLLNRAD